MVDRKLITDLLLKAVPPAPQGERNEIWTAASPASASAVTDLVDRDPTRRGKTGKHHFRSVRQVYTGRGTDKARHRRLWRITLEQARTTAGEWRSMIAKGIDPAVIEAERRAAEARERAIRVKHSFANVAETFMADKLAQERRGKSAERDLRSTFVAAWGDRQIGEITKLDVLEIINAKKRHRAAVWPCAVRAQQASKSARVGWLTAQRAASLTPFVDAFRMSLADLGYVEGRTLEIAFRYGDDVVERVPELAAELIHLPVDLIVAQGAAVSVLSKLNLPVPIVYVTSGDPVVAGFAESLARPHGNRFLAKDLLEQAFPLLWVSGEISNIKCYGSGHWYFSLKDSDAQVRCVMFREKNQYLGWQPQDGMQVEVRALVTLYPARGDFQLNVETIRRVGLGTLFEAFEQLRARLGKEGLFDPGRKKILPLFPEQIGIITSPDGAALHDVLSTLRRRMPSLPVIVYPVPVQGIGASVKIAAAIQKAASRAECDVLILCRGGGSIEDLWAFNEEVVARAIAACSLPIISGVGHETDFTIADFVADIRAPTPTGASQLVCQDREELLRRVEILYCRMQRDAAARH